MPLDDPTLALIARFVVHEADQPDISSERYLRDQLAEIQCHIESLPAERQQQAVLDWIAEHAERYRREWYRRQVSDLILERRCDDCPLADDGTRSHCLIHKRWVGLLNEYITGEIHSEKYIEATLRLLSEHKNRLKVSRLSARM